MPVKEKQEEDRRQRKMFIGVVTSDKMEKTIVVNVERLVRHARFGKYVRRFTKCYTHDEKGEAHRGDRVEIMETRPLSRLKRWRLVRIVEKGAAIPEGTRGAASEEPAAKS
ncbi:MAG TPA: 30S ribosomal protein S17 [Planctomycetota bacterium]|nr:30S ribosomal protein S17 [Planctomycetota bacterium]